MYIADIENELPQIPENISRITHNFRNDRREKEYLSGRALAFRGLKENGFLGEVKFKIKDGGKVYVENAPDFSISHDGKYVICAISDKTVGADIVKNQRFENKKTFRYFTEKEIMHITEKSEKTAFLWSLKEAYSKMTGEGLSEKISGFDFSNILDEICLPWGKYINGIFVYSFEKQGHTITVCTTEKEEPELVELGI